MCEPNMYAGIKAFRLIQHHSTPFITTGMTKFQEDRKPESTKDLLYQPKEWSDKKCQNKWDGENC